MEQVTGGLHLAHYHDQVNGDLGSYHYFAIISHLSSNSNNFALHFVVILQC